MKTRTALLIALLATGVVIGLDWVGAFDALERIASDDFVRMHADRPLDRQIALVYATDEDASILESEWPWDRSIHAQLLVCLREAGARVVVFDVLFDAADAEQPGDAAFRDTLASTRDAVAGCVFDMYADRDLRGPTPDTARAHSIPTPLRASPERAGELFFPHAGFSDRLAAVGFLNADTDPDGVTRRNWLLLEHQGRLFPSLPLAAFLTLRGIDLAEVVGPDDGILRLPAADGTRWTPPVDSRGRVLIDFHGDRVGAFTRSYVDVFARYEEQGADGLAEFRDRIVIVASALTGSGDTVATPLSADTRGALVQAIVLDNLLSGRLLRPAPPVVPWVLILACALGIATSLVARWPWWRLVGAGLVLAAPLVIGAWALRSPGISLPVVPATVAGALTWIVAGTLAAVVRRRRKRLVESTFQRFLPKQALESLLRDPKSDLAQVERVGVAILLARLDGIAHSVLEPEDEADLTNAILSAVGHEVRASGGTLVRMNQEQVLAVFGEPLPLDAPAAACIACALAARDAVQRLNHRWIDRVGSPVSIGCAVHEGVVTIGVFGSDFHRSYDATGRSVTEALALLAQAGPGQVLASERIANQVPDSLEAVAIGSGAPGGAAFELVRRRSP